MNTLFDLLLLGLPGERPGGLVLTVISFFSAASGGLILGSLYAIICVAMPRVSWLLMACSALLRGIPPILLVFALAHVPGFSPVAAGVLGLALYSFSHSGEIIRAYLAIYPRPLADAARVLGLLPILDWTVLRLGWSFRRCLPALTTHWISLLKDTGALVILGIGELTTTAKLISESSGSMETWTRTLAMAAVLYVLATVALLAVLNALRSIVDPTMRARPTQMPAIASNL